MRPNPEDLRRHYASLSDKALQAIDRTELVEIAQKCYDEEVARRSPSSAVPVGRFDDEPGADNDDLDSGPEPDWLEDATCACTFPAVPGNDAAPDAENARDVLQKAGIPCHITVEKIDPPRTTPQTRHEYRLMVPGTFDLQAASVLDKEIYNPEMEEEWKAHFEAMSDDELRALDPHVLVAGLADRIERLTRVYDEEIARRRLS